MAENKKVEAPVEDMPSVDQDTQAYLGAMMQMLHDPSSSPAIVDMLRSGPPEQTVPKTALTVNAQFESMVKQEGKPPSLETLLVAGTYLVADLVEMGNAAGAFQVSEDQLGGLIQGTMQEYIQAGLKDGSIDPVELQEAVEPLMDEEHAALGLAEGEARGLPAQASTQTAMESYASQRERGALDKVAREGAKKKEAEKNQGQPQGAMQGPQGGQ